METFIGRFSYMDRWLFNMDVDVIQVGTSKNQLQYCEGRKGGNLCIRKMKNLMHKKHFITIVLLSLVNLPSQVLLGFLNWEAHQVEKKVWRVFYICPLFLSIQISQVWWLEGVGFFFKMLKVKWITFRSWNKGIVGGPRKYQDVQK